MEHVQDDTKLTCSDMRSEFLEHITLQYVIGQNRACKILQTIVNARQWHRTQKITRANPIILYGKYSCSAVARAFSNSLGMLHHQEFNAEIHGQGTQVYDCLDKIDEFSSYHIGGINCIAYLWQKPILRLVQEHIIDLPQHPGYGRVEHKHFDGQLVLSAEKPTRFSSELEKYCEAVVHLSEQFGQEEISGIISQRIHLYRLQVRNPKEFIDAIVQVSAGDVKLCITLFMWACKCCFAEGASSITLRHLNLALKLIA